MESDVSDYSAKDLVSFLIFNYWKKLTPPPPVDIDSLRDGTNRAMVNRTWTFNFYIKPIIDQFILWLETSKENANFTYDLTELNYYALAGLVDVVTNCGIANAMGFLTELKQDDELREHLNNGVSKSEFQDYSDLNQGYGRRMGWYSFIRAIKPRVVVETGVDKGLGSCVIAAALLRNASEGFPGKYIGTDINPQAGYLFTGRYSEVGNILYGDSINSLLGLSDSIDIFINDSDHSAEYEANEYKIIHTLLSSRSIILGDNAHATSSLFEYAINNNKKYLFFSEKPTNHFYPGAGIGVCF